MDKNKKIKLSVALSIGVIILFLAGFFLLGGEKYTEEHSPEIDKSTTLEEASKVAETWIIEHSATYRERGGSGLSLLESEELAEGWYDFVFEFTTEDSGYGRPEDGMEEEKDSEKEVREIIVRTYYNHLKAAIVDGAYDDLSLMPVEEIDMPEPGIYDEDEEELADDQENEKTETEYIENDDEAQVEEEDDKSSSPEELFQ